MAQFIRNIYAAARCTQYICSCVQCTPVFICLKDRTYAIEAKFAEGKCKHLDMNGILGARQLVQPNHWLTEVEMVFFCVATTISHSCTHIDFSMLYLGRICALLRVRQGENSFQNQCYRHCCSPEEPPYSYRTNGQQSAVETLPLTTLAMPRATPLSASGCPSPRTNEMYSFHFQFIEFEIELMGLPR